MSKLMSIKDIRALKESCRVLPDPAPRLIMRLCEELIRALEEIRKLKER